MMKKQDKLTLLSAFLIGMIAGSYLYLVGYAPEFQSGQGVDTQNEEEEFMVVGEVYGGMRAGIPPTFQILADGSYRYVKFSDNVEVPGEVLEGNLPKDMFRSLKNSTSLEVLEDAAREIQPEMCAQMVDGLDYKYTIVKEGEEYDLNTCGTNISIDEGLGAELADLWDYFANLE